MSSIRTGTSPGGAGTQAGCWRATARSASLSAAQIQVTSASGAIAASPDVTPATRPPPPRRPVSVPSGPNWYDTGPRLDATRTRFFIARQGSATKGQASPPGQHLAGLIRLSRFRHNCITLIQRGGGIGPAKPRQPIAHPCPIRAARRVTWCQVRPAVKVTAWERWGKEVLAGDYSYTTHPQSF